MTNECRIFSKNGFHQQITFGQHPIKDPNDIPKVNAQQMAS
jgi:hypothetical protein